MKDLCDACKDFIEYILYICENKKKIFASVIKLLLFLL